MNGPKSTGIILAFLSLGLDVCAVKNTFCGDEHNIRDSQRVHTGSLKGRKSLVFLAVISSNWGRCDRIRVFSDSRQCIQQKMRCQRNWNCYAVVERRHFSNGKRRQRFYSHHKQRRRKAPKSSAALGREFSGKVQTLGMLVVVQRRAFLLNLTTQEVKLSVSLKRKLLELPSAVSHSKQEDTVFLGYRGNRDLIEFVLRKRSIIEHDVNLPISSLAADGKRNMLFCGCRNTIKRLRNNGRWERSVSPNTTIREIRYIRDMCLDQHGKLIYFATDDAIFSLTYEFQNLHGFQFNKERPFRVIDFDQETEHLYYSKGKVLYKAHKSQVRHVVTLFAPRVHDLQDVLVYEGVIYTSFIKGKTVSAFDSKNSSVRWSIPLSGKLKGGMVAVFDFR